MNQEIYNLFSLLATASLTVAVLMLRHEYQCFRKDVTRILGALGIVVINSGQGMTVKVEERKGNERVH